MADAVRLLDTGNGPAWLDREEYPFASCTWRTPAGLMHYVDEGEGEPVVMVHGVPTWSFNYRKLIKRLSPGFRCVAMDHLGFGLSDKPPAWHYRPQALAANVGSLIDGLGLKRVTLVVHDWGGPIGLWYALERPENVARVVLLNTWMWSTKGDGRQELASRGLGNPVYRLLEERFNFTARAFIPNVMGDGARLTRDVHRHYLEPLRERDERRGCWRLIRAMLRSGDWLDGLWERRERLARIPAFVVWGLRDRAFTRADLEQWRGVFRDVEVQALPRVGHFPQEELRAEDWAPLEAFLRRPWRARGASG
jgi:pimeloyl-ACP methyl ester carboxylesterase